MASSTCEVASKFYLVYFDIIRVEAFEDFIKFMKP